MPEFAANLTLMYNECAFLDRFDAAAKDGFKGGEFLFPYNFVADEIQTRLIEPINTRDMPGYFLNRQDDAQAICRDVGAPNLKVQFDLYHCQIVEGDVAMKMRRDIACIGHMQIAGVPERHEPDIGELNYPYLFPLMDELGYDGWVGCEYRPKWDTSDGLGWFGAWLNRGH